ncbi:trypsin-like peptidase domain-containing protein [Chryseobacterium gleum]|uniref:trypsin-like peptidase domain-containing protein n=1 Tax=Chryseobacterium gleum TaxID=250 RepID=UPI0028A90F8D|nr:trypsin-like peptidase domain-containing protein [Chryseobacterium gleum]
MNHLTKCSVFIECFLNEGAVKPIAIGTAFIARYHNDYFLVTNWHCVTGKNPETSDNLGGLSDPEYLQVHFLAKGSTNKWIPKKIMLIGKDFKPTYLLHPKGNEVDVVAIKLPVFDDVDYHSIWDGVWEKEFDKDITDTVSIIGFPKGISTAGKLPIWKTGHIASEIEVDHDNKPQFLIDASTRKGMSGSPVYCVKSGVIQMDGRMMGGPGIAVNFLGIYAGRLGDDIEIGRVFKSNCLDEIIDNHYKRQTTQTSPFTFWPNYILKDSNS